MQFELKLVCNNCCINSIAVKIITIFIRTSFLKQENNQFEPNICIFKWVSPLQVSKNIKYKIFNKSEIIKQRIERTKNLFIDSFKNISEYLWQHEIQKQLNCSKRYTSSGCGVAHRLGCQKTWVWFSPRPRWLYWISHLPSFRQQT